MSMITGLVAIVCNQIKGPMYYAIIILTLSYVPIFASHVLLMSLMYCWILMGFICCACVVIILVIEPLFGSVRGAFDGPIPLPYTNSPLDL